MEQVSDERLSSSLEDYLEAVLFLVRQKRVARVRDIASHVGVGSPAVTAALKTLSKRGLVNYDRYQVITLTDHGRELAEAISYRHHSLRLFLAEVLGMDNTTAEANACRIEHAVDDEFLDRLTRFGEFIRRCPRAGRQWVENFSQGRCDGSPSSNCSSCTTEVAESLRQGLEGRS